MLRGALVHGSVQMEENKSEAAAGPVCSTLFRGFKDPPEVNTHMVGRLVSEQEDETQSDSLPCPS